MRLEAVKISKIKGAVYQPRQQKEKDIEELVKSILNCGLLTNITLFTHPEILKLCSS